VGAGPGSRARRSSVHLISGARDGIGQRQLLKHQASRVLVAERLSAGACCRRERMQEAGEAIGRTAETPPGRLQRRDKHSG